MSNVFTLPETVLFSFQGQRAVGAALTDIHMLMNVNLEPEFNVLAVRPSAITARSVSTLLKYQMLRQVNATHDFAHAAGIGFHVTSIDMVAPDDVDTLEFNTAYMRALYAGGLRRARAGSAWSAALPPLEGGEAIVSTG